MFSLWTRCGKHESWSAHCRDDSQSGDDCSTAQQTPTHVSPLWTGCILQRGLSPQAAQLFLISLISLHQCGTVWPRWTERQLLSQTATHWGDFSGEFSNQRNHCKLFSSWAQSSTQESEPPHYSLKCSDVGLLTSIAQMHTQIFGIFVFHNKNQSNFSFANR